jgi:nucleoside-diphosphate-sugar epimerase
MRVMLSGSAGFIGSHLTNRYLADGHFVLGIDNLLTGNLANIEDVRPQSRFVFLNADVCDQHEAIRACIEKHGGPDIVLHFASPASPVDYGNHPIKTLRVNSRGTEVMAELALQYGAAFLYASTSEAYGDPLEHPQRETYWGNVNPVGVRSCYDESKRYGEAFVSAMIRTRGLNGRIIRIFNTYGPRMQINDGRVVPNFVNQALKGEPLTIYGDGSQTRSFCYVDDLVEGIVRCAASDKTRATVINLGNPEEHSIREFAEIVCRIADVPLQIKAMPLPPDDPTRRCPDISRAKELLGWEPRVSLEDGLRQTITYFRERV